MIVLDTNVLSALMQPTANSAVVDWLDGQSSRSVYTTSITILEIRYGIRILPAGRRRNALEAGFETLVVEILEGRILQFDLDAAECAAEIAASRRRNGRPVTPPNTQIAGIAVSRKAVLATRNVKDFEDAGCHLVNPWLD